MVYEDGSCQQRRRFVSKQIFVAQHEEDVKLAPAIAKLLEEAFDYVDEVEKLSPILPIQPSIVQGRNNQCVTINQKGLIAAEIAQEVYMLKIKKVLEII